MIINKKKKKVTLQLKKFTKCAEASNGEPFPKKGVGGKVDRYKYIYEKWECLFFSFVPFRHAPK
jgi:hypothetical protein